MISVSIIQAGDEKLLSPGDFKRDAGKYRIHLV
jgi:hypothetical protein